MGVKAHAHLQLAPTARLQAGHYAAAGSAGRKTDTDEIPTVVAMGLIGSKQIMRQVFQSTPRLPVSCKGIRLNLSNAWFKFLEKIPQIYDEKNILFSDLA
jgi:hypothetical protein